MLPEPHPNPSEIHRADPKIVDTHWLGVCGDGVGRGAGLGWAGGRWARGWCGVGWGGVGWGQGVLGTIDLGPRPHALGFAKKMSVC